MRLSGGRWDAECVTAPANRARRRDAPRCPSGVTRFKFSLRVTARCMGRLLGDTLLTQAGPLPAVAGQSVGRRPPQRDGRLGGHQGPQRLRVRPGLREPLQAQRLHPGPHPQAGVLTPRRVEPAVVLRAHGGRRGGVIRAVRVCDWTALQLRRGQVPCTPLHPSALSPAQRRPLKLHLTRPGRGGLRVSQYQCYARDCAMTPSSPAVQGKVAPPPIASIPARIGLGKQSHHVRRRLRLPLLGTMHAIGRPAPAAPHDPLHRLCGVIVIVCELLHRRYVTRCEDAEAVENLVAFGRDDGLREKRTAWVGGRRAKGSRRTAQSSDGRDCSRFT